MILAADGLLMAACVGVILFSIGMVFLPQLSQPFFNWLIFQNTINPFPDDANQYIRFAFMVMGAVMIGWMVALLAIIAIPFRRGERWAWWTVALSMVIWFVVDTSMSLGLGYAPNAALNTVFLGVFVVPLGLSYGSTKAALSPRLKNES